MLVFKAWRKSPALTQETTPSQRRITRILSDAQQAAAREFGQSITTVAELLSRGQTDRVVAMLPTEPWLVAQEALAEELLGELLDAGSRVTLPAIEKATLAYSFDRERPESSQWARQAAGTMISQITGEQRNVVREIVSAAALGEMDWGDVARQVQGSIGLTTQQAGWVSNRYDSTYLNAIRNGLNPQRAAAQARDAASRYQTAVHRYRANTIARTETMRAASEGRMQAWNQGITQGFIGANWQKEWIPEADACDICLGLRGKRINIKDSFSVGEPPAHPNCRCDVILVPPKVEPTGAGLGSTAFSALSTIDDLILLGKIPTPSIEELRQWQQAYNLSTRRGDDRSFREWFEDVIEPDITVHADEGDGRGRVVQPGDDDNIVAPKLEGVDADDIFGELLDEQELDRAYKIGDTFNVDIDATNALKGYQWSDFLPINELLRSGATDLGEWLKNVQLIDSLFDVLPPLRVGGEYFRTLDARVLAGLKRGDTFIDDGYMSTSISREAAEEFAEDSGYSGKMRIIDLAGARKIYVEGVTFQDGFDQGEVLFYRGTPLRYIGKDKDGWDVFVTASYKVEPPNRFAPPKVEVPPHLQFMDDADFLDFDEDNWDLYSEAIYRPGRYWDVDEPERQALQWYMFDGYQPINAHLIYGGGSPEVRKAAYLIDMMFEDAHTVDAPIRVWRGLLDSDFLGNLEPGSIFVNKSFMSTTAAPEVTDEFYSNVGDLFGNTGRSPALLRINVPRGTLAMLMPDSDELEVLFRPGVSMRVIKTVFESVRGVNNGRPVKVVYVELIPDE